LSRIFYYWDASTVRDFHDRIHVSRHTKQVDRNDCLGLRCERCFQFLRIDVVSEEIDINKNSTRAQSRNRSGRGNEGEWSCYDFIIAADFQGHQREKQRIGT
jgi:hypothetical protein